MKTILYITLFLLFSSNSFSLSTKTKYITSGVGTFLTAIGVGTGLAVKISHDKAKIKRKNSELINLQRNKEANDAEREEHLASAHAEISELKGKIETAEAGINRIRQEKDNIEDNLQNANQNNGVLNQEKQALRQQEADLNKQLNQLQIALHQAQDDLVRANDQVFTSSADKRKINNEFIQLKDENEELYNKFNEVNEENTKFIADIEKLQKDYDDMKVLDNDRQSVYQTETKSMMNTLKERDKNHHNKTQGLQAKLDQLNSDNDKLHAEIAAVKIRNGAKESHRIQLENRFSALKNEYDESLKEYYSVLQVERRDQMNKAEEIKVLKEKNELLSAKKGNLQSFYNQEVACHSRTNNELLEVRKENQDIEEHYMDTLNALDDTRSQLAQLKEKITDKKTIENKLTKRLVAANTERFNSDKSLTIEREKAVNVAEQYESELYQKNSDLDKARLSILSLRHKVEERAAVNEDLESQLRLANLHKNNATLLGLKNSDLKRTIKNMERTSNAQKRGSTDGLTRFQKDHEKMGALISDIRSTLTDTTPFDSTQAASESGYSSESSRDTDGVLPFANEDFESMIQKTTVNASDQTEFLQENNGTVRSTAKVIQMTPARQPRNVVTIEENIVPTTSPFENTPKQEMNLEFTPKNSLIKSIKKGWNSFKEARSGNATSCYHQVQ